MKFALLELQRELDKSDRLLEKASSLVLLGAKKKPSKADQDKQKELDQEIRDSLKDRKYKDQDSGNEVVFNTAYSRQHPTAVKDYNKAMSKALSKEKAKGGKPKPLSDEQQDIVNRVLSGNRKFDDLSLGEERNLREALSTLSDIGVVIDIVIDDRKDLPEPKNEAVVKAVKKRKTRSDKGKKRGQYKKKVKKEVLEEVLTDEQKDQVDIEELVEITDMDLQQTSEALEEREKSRGRGKDKKKRKTRKKPGEDDKTIEEDVEELGPDDIEDVGPPPIPTTEEVLTEIVDGIPLLEQSPSVQKKIISDKLEAIFKNELDPQGELEQKINKLEGKLEWAVLMSSEEEEAVKKEIADLKKEKRKKDLAETEKSTNTLRSKIDSSIEVLEGLSEAQVEQMGISYESSAKEVADILRDQGFEELRSWLKDEFKDGEPPQPPISVDELNEDIVESERKANQQEQRVKDSKAKVDKLAKAEREIASLPPESEERAAKIEELSDLLGPGTTANDITDFTAALDDAKESLKSQEDKLSKEKDKLKSLEKDMEEYDTLQEKYASDLGTYLALKNAQDGILNDPEFGLRDFPVDADEEDQKVHSSNVRKSQGQKFKKMEKEDRDAMVGHIEDRLQELDSKLQDTSLSKEERAKLEGQLGNVKASQQALNTVRMLNGEGVMTGFHDVDEKILNVARETGSDAWDEAITDLSTYGSSPEAAKEHMRNVADNLDSEGFSQLMGGEDGEYGSMIQALDPKFCPGSEVNRAKGVGGKKLSPGETCPNPMPDDVKNFLKQYMTDSFVNLNTIDKDRYRSDPKRPKAEVSQKKQEEAKFFWRKRKDKFFQFFIDGVDNLGNPVSDEDKIAFGEQFRSEWFEGDMKQVVRGGIKLYDNSDRKYDFNQLMEELKRARSIKGPTERADQLRSIREKIQSIFDETTTSATSQKSANYFNRSFIDGCYKSGGSKSMQKISTQYVDYQERSQAFELGMRVYPFLGGNPSRSGIIVAIFPAIGMVDVQFPHGSMRYPVEDLVVDTSGDYKNLTNEQSSVPGGLGTVPVTTTPSKKQASRVASNYVKQAIYWYKKDRTYRQCRNEEKPCCPKCKTPLGNTVYKRRGGRSEKLLACYTCLFIIKPSDIIGG